ncbi:LexA family transcriptional regulator [Helicobacter apodemus]|nr:LexA family transcriptional regulator [Helicobacter apodemus]
MLKEIRETKGITQIQLAKMLGVSERTIRKYEQEEDSMQVGMFKKIMTALDMSSNSPAILQKVSSNTSKSVQQSPKNTEIISSKGVSLPQTLNDDIVSIPFYEDITASAGSGAYNEAETAEQLNFPKSFLRQYFGIVSFNNLSIIIGKGDSMYPTLPKNCYLLVQNGSVSDGEICITRIEDELYVKRLQKRPKLKLLSDNKAYDPIELEGENFEIIGRVVGYFKKTTL